MGVSGVFTQKRFQQEFWKKIEFPGGADDSYVHTGVKASNCFMPKKTLSEKGPDGGGWIVMNKYLQVETSVWGDSVSFAVDECNYGCSGSPSYPSDEQTIETLAVPLAAKIFEVPVIQTQGKTQQGVNTHVQHVVDTVEVEKHITQEKINQMTKHTPVQKTMEVSPL